MKKFRVLILFLFVSLYSYSLEFYAISDSGYTGYQLPNTSGGGYTTAYRYGKYYNCGYDVYWQSGNGWIFKLPYPTYNYSLITPTAQTFADNPNLADLNIDTDGDGVNDYYDTILGGVYNNSSITPDMTADFDGDGYSNQWEIDNGFDPITPMSQSDTDNDGWNDASELALGTNPNDDTLKSLDFTEYGVENPYPFEVTMKLYLDDATGEGFLIDEFNMGPASTNGFPLMYELDDYGSIPDGCTVHAELINMETGEVMPSEEIEFTLSPSVVADGVTVPKNLDFSDDGITFPDILNTTTTSGGGATASTKTSASTHSVESVNDAWSNAAASNIPDSVDNDAKNVATGIALSKGTIADAIGQGLSVGSGVALGDGSGISDSGIDGDLFGLETQIENADLSVSDPAGLPVDLTGFTFLDDLISGFTFPSVGSQSSLFIDLPEFKGHDFGTFYIDASNYTIFQSIRSLELFFLCLGSIFIAFYLYRWAWA